MPCRALFIHFKPFGKLVHCRLLECACKEGSPSRRNETLVLPTNCLRGSPVPLRARARAARCQAHRRTLDPLTTTRSKIETGRRCSCRRCDFLQRGVFARTLPHCPCPSRRTVWGCVVIIVRMRRPVVQHILGIRRCGCGGGGGGSYSTVYGSDRARLGAPERPMRRQGSGTVPIWCIRCGGIGWMVVAMRSVPVVRSAPPLSLSVVVVLVSVWHSLSSSRVSPVFQPPPTTHDRPHAHTPIHAVGTGYLFLYCIEWKQSLPLCRAVISTPVYGPLRACGGGRSVSRGGCTVQ